MKRAILTLSLTFTVLLFGAASAQTSLPDVRALRGWIEAMKESPRGPFERIRWFCNDGTVQPPSGNPCRQRGGGVQHGEWNRHAEVLRSQGYYIANVLADIDPRDLMGQENFEEIFKHIILEQFLIDADDGWIFRRARFYWGALQAEDEEKGARNLLLALMGDPEWRNSRYTVLREAVRLLPHGRKGSPVTQMRQLSRSIAERDKGFKSLRVKIHTRSDPGDASRVRDYARTRGVPELLSDYEQLARSLEEVYRPRGIEKMILSLADETADPKVAQSLRSDAGLVSAQHDLSTRIRAVSNLLAVLRGELSGIKEASTMLDFMDTSVILEGELFRWAEDLREEIPKSTPRERISWLRDLVPGLYGAGLISEQEWHTLRDSLSSLLSHPQVDLITYKTELDYLSRVPGWADRLLRFHFLTTVIHLSAIEPLTRQYLHDRLRGSPLLLYAQVLDGLMEEVDGRLGIRHELFGNTVSGRLRALNPGLARGILKFVQEGREKRTLDPQGIYVLPSTTADLPPVAGILSMGQGNSLSHVQLLARNLGIPNVAVDKDLAPLLAKEEGRRVVLAVSPHGVVRLVEDSSGWDTVFEREPGSPHILIPANHEKLDLGYQEIIPLHDLRAGDSGRIAGPKAANLGELKIHFPGAVPDGLVIPFGVFRTLLDRPIEPDGPTAFQWIQDQYGVIRGLKGDPRKPDELTRHFLERIREWIVSQDPGASFRDRLQAEMEQLFGRDGTYGVFVRSDTNVEDLHGFTGAGLNLTVPNVVGFENVMTAIRRVWASPFTERAYKWRQDRMERPEQVYVSVILMKSVPVEKSGVMVTADLETGDPDWLSIAVNEGLGGAVDGQAAEELRVHMVDGKTRFLEPAGERYKRVLLPEGGVTKIKSTRTEGLLERGETDALVNLAKSLPNRFPMPHDEQSRPLPVDIEFGFLKGRLVLLQIRPFVQSLRARQSLFLKGLDQGLEGMGRQVIDLDRPQRVYP